MQSFTLRLPRQKASWVLAVILCPITLRYTQQEERMKTRDILRLIHDDGWYQVAQRGSHRQFKHPTKPGRVTIAGHPSEEMDEGTRKSIFKQAGLNP
jgi:predicted RNA binding protein YcfA (HicA-like mRNA interferase family)